MISDNKKISQKFLSLHSSMSMKVWNKLSQKC